MTFHHAIWRVHFVRLVPKSYFCQLSGAEFRTNSLREVTPQLVREVVTSSKLNLAIRERGI